MAQEIIKEKAAQIVDRFPWAYYITWKLRPQLTSMVENYLEEDTFSKAQNEYNKFMNAFYYQPHDLNIRNGKDTKPVSEWYFDRVYKWKAGLDQAWLEIHGPRHTREEIMKLAADFWCDRIFDRSRQDNGDNSDTGCLGMMMASMLKTDAMNKQDSSVRDKAWHLIAEYYGKVFDKSLPNRFECGLCVDYQPCEQLYEILKDAGMNEKDIDVIVSIKTSLYLRDFDKSLSGTSGYGNFIDL